MRTEEEIRREYEAKLAELVAQGQEVWFEALRGEENFGHAAQPWPRLSPPFGQGISESWGWDILVQGSCQVGQTFRKPYDNSRWTVVFSEECRPSSGFGSMVIYWIAVRAEERAVVSQDGRSSKDLARETTAAYLGPEVAKLL